MKRITMIAALAVSALLVMASAAFAETLTENFANAPGGTHYVQHTPTPTCTVIGTTVTCPTEAFELAGVGNTNATADLTVIYSATILCNNPAEANRNNPIEVHTQFVSETTSSGLLSPKNGRLTIEPLTVTAPTEEEVLAQASCPNENWVPEVEGGSVTLVSYTFTVTFEGFTEPAITITGP
jgi:hypothetical protein